MLYVNSRWMTRLLPLFSPVAAGNTLLYTTSSIGIGIDVIWLEPKPEGERQGHTRRFIHKKLNSDWSFPWSSLSLEIIHG